MKTLKEKIVIKKPHSSLFPEAVINDDLNRYHESPANRKKVADAKKFLSKFGYQ